MQSTSHILMIRPAAFGFNEQAAGSNAFQKNETNEQVQQQALQEFDALAQLLQSKGVNVIVQQDTEEPVKPDAIFPNNWVSFHDSGDVLLYPMQAENRRMERREDVIRKLEDCFKVNHIIDLSRFEMKQQFLEGTGSLVLDRENKIAYACISPRTHHEVIEEFCKFFGYTSLTFNATDDRGTAIYHTNVLMSIGSQFAVVCLDSIKNEQERQQVINSLTRSGKEIVNISLEQLQHFTGNMLEVKSSGDKPLLVMSQQAFESLSDEQKETLGKHAELIYSDLRTIEAIGGGSARCMLAEVHLPMSS